MCGAPLCPLLLCTCVYNTGRPREQEKWAQVLLRDDPDLLQLSYPDSYKNGECTTVLSAGAFGPFTALTYKERYTIANCKGNEVEKARHAWNCLLLLLLVSFLFCSCMCCIGCRSAYKRRARVRSTPLATSCLAPLPAPAGALQLLRAMWLENAACVGEGGRGRQAIALGGAGVRDSCREYALASVPSSVRQQRPPTASVEGGTCGGGGRARAPRATTRSSWRPRCATVALRGDAYGCLGHF